ncbi:hypothetical protein M422DRAFT_36516 [Sphaerobolus stellatus SS14]|uniref:Uncharacterized protein n=1 Tax=Sphaerobolus stellatus (strain SS14) TaxID=990650 RepID=A0A0C9UYR0_SPHS4|nr:hypothetical protein M422DRAFT_36516 [Sphaerobolus stellatus SS14]
MRSSKSFARTLLDLSICLGNGTWRDRSTLSPPKDILHSRPSMASAVQFTIQGDSNAIHISALIAILRTMVRTYIGSPTFILHSRLLISM